VAKRGRDREGNLTLPCKEDRLLGIGVCIAAGWYFMRLDRPFAGTPAPHTLRRLFVGYTALSAVRGFVILAAAPCPCVRIEREYE